MSTECSDSICSSTVELKRHVRFLLQFACIQRFVVVFTSRSEFARQEFTVLFCEDLCIGRPRTLFSSYLPLRATLCLVPDFFAANYPVSLLLLHQHR